jgi:hypothetical protein
VSDEIMGWPIAAAFFCAALITFIASFKVNIGAPERRSDTAGKLFGRTMRPSERAAIESLCACSSIIVRIDGNLAENCWPAARHAAAGTWRLVENCAALQMKQ